MDILTALVGLAVLIVIVAALKFYLDYRRDSKKIIAAQTGKQGNVMNAGIGPALIDMALNELNKTGEAMKGLGVTDAQLKPLGDLYRKVEFYKNHPYVMQIGSNLVNNVVNALDRITKKMF